MTGLMNLLFFFGLADDYILDYLYILKMSNLL